jgi:hypothetical protein
METHAFLRSIARRQDGVVTHGQAPAAGVPLHEIATLCLAGRRRPLAAASTSRSWSGRR